MMFLAVFGGYFLVSMFLLKYPILHKRKQLKFRPKHISHRGGAAERIENTMEAFKYAESLGTEMLELDCHITKDEKVVVSHDDMLTRTCGVSVRISETDYKELPLLNDKITVDFYQSLKGEGEDRRIPLLEEVFQTFPSMPVNVDIKINNDLLMAKVDAMIRKYKREDLTAWGNRSSEICDKLHNLNPRVPLIFSLSKVVQLMLLFWSGLLPFVPIRESLLEVIIPGLLMDAEDIFQRRINRKQKFLFWLLDKLLMRPSLIAHLEKRGIQTYLWVLNREKDYERAFTIGAVGVMTDRVSHLKNFLSHSPHGWCGQAKE